MAGGHGKGGGSPAPLGAAAKKIEPLSFGGLPPEKQMKNIDQTESHISKG